MKEILFSPRSLRRVAQAVEWEDELVMYNDGSTNQAEYTTAVGILLGRWLMDWTDSDFAEALATAGAESFVATLNVVLLEVQKRVAQLVGFYTGLASSFTEGKVSGRWVSPWSGTDTGTAAYRARVFLRVAFDNLSSILAAVKE